jgi:RHS repeat-associated protein
VQLVNFGRKTLVSFGRKRLVNFGRKRVVNFRPKLDTGLGYTGEWYDANVGLTYLRARWYDGTTGRFTQKDLLDQASFYLYARNNPVLYIDPSGFLSLKPGYIENAVGGISLFTFAGQLDWLRAAVHNVPELWQLYTYTKDEIDSNRFSSGTLRDLYEYTFSEARKLFDDSFECVHFPDLEYAHAALIVLAYIPANHDEDGRTWDKYPLFMPDGRPHEPGWDKAGHFFLNAFTAFEGKYSLEYTRNRELIDIARMGSLMGGIIGWNNISAIEADYLTNTDAPYWGSEGLTGDDAALFNSLITIGNGYELLTSLNHLPDSLLGDSKIGSLIRDHGNTEKSNMQPKDLIILMALDRICNGGRNIDILVETLLQQVRDPARNEGLLDSGVYRDQVANRLGVHFGIQVFNNPAIIPAIPYDVGISGFRQIQVGGQSAYIYDFP